MDENIRIEFGDLFGDPKKLFHIVENNSIHRVLLSLFNVSMDTCRWAVARQEPT